jgi:hypothetical protein
MEGFSQRTSLRPQNEEKLLRTQAFAERVFEFTP